MDSRVLRWVFIWQEATRGASGLSALGEAQRPMWEAAPSGDKVSSSPGKPSFLSAIGKERSVCPMFICPLKMQAAV